jgi:hypothetical protein
MSSGEKLMREILRVCRRLLVIACVAGFVSASAWSGGALAISPYTVAVRVVPNHVQLQGVFNVTASGHSANLSRLKVFLNKSVPCRPTAFGDATVASDVLLINTTVVHGYVKTKAFTAVNLGNHFACAYLTSVPPPTKTLLRARASAPYAIN